MNSSQNIFFWRKLWSQLLPNRSQVTVSVAARVRTVRTCRDDGCWDGVYCRFPIASKCLEVLVESRKHQCEQLLLCVSLLCWIVVEFMFKHRNVKEKKLPKYKSGWESVRSCRGRLVIPAVHLSTVSARRQDAKLYPATEITQFVGLTNLIQTRKVWKVLEEYRLVWGLCKPTIQSPRCSWNWTIWVRKFFRLQICPKENVSKYSF